MRRYAEKLVTLARKGGLNNRRLLIARTGSIEATSHLMDVIVPSLKRESGYLRITRTGFRRGDNAETATIAFVDEIAEPKKVETKPETKKEEKK